MPERSDCKWRLAPKSGRCRLCGSNEDQHEFWPERVLGTNQSLHRCGQCAGVYLAPDFTDASMHQFYESDYRRIFLGQFSKTYDDEFFRHRLMREYNRKRAELLSDLLPPGAHIFEIGSGFGGFLGQIHVIRPDLVLSASEPDRANRHRLLDGAVVHFVENDGFGERGGLDAVVAFHVLEHIKAPRELLRGVHDALLPGGKLIIEVPDVLTPWHGWTYVHPAHVSCFSAASLRRLLCRCGFLVDEVGPHRLGPAFHGMVWAQAHGPSHGETAEEASSATREEIDRLDSHISQYSWSTKDSIMRLLKDAAIRIFGADWLGRRQRARFYRLHIGYFE